MFKCFRAYLCTFSPTFGSLMATAGWLGPASALVYPNALLNNIMNINDEIFFLNKALSSWLKTKSLGKNVSMLHKSIA